MKFRESILANHGRPKGSCGQHHIPGRAISPTNTVYVNVLNKGVQRVTPTEVGFRARTMRVGSDTHKIEVKEDAKQNENIGVRSGGDAESGAREEFYARLAAQGREVGLQAGKKSRGRPKMERGFSKESEDSIDGTPRET